MTKTILLGMVAASFFIASWAQAEEAAAPPMVGKVHADRGFIDDPFALSSDGKAVAYLTTDGATQCELTLMQLASSDTPKKTSCDSLNAERMEFLDDERVLVVERDPITRFARARVYGRAGGRLGPASEIALGQVGGVPAIVTYTKATKGANVSHSFAAYRRNNLKPIATRTVIESGEGKLSLAGAVVKPLFFAGGYAVVVAQKPGRYDKKLDVRKPDVAAHIDLFSGKILEEKEIGDLVAWARVVEQRRGHENQRSFLFFSEDLKELRLMTGEDAPKALTLTRPLGKYDPQTLAYQPCGEAICFSLAIDPVNPEAVAAKKTDKDWIDFYRVDLKSGAVTELARIDGEKRGARWHMAADRLGLLRKLKGFGRGGADLQVFSLGK